MRPIREWTSYVTPDGTVYPFHVPSYVGRWVVAESGWGTPPLEFITERAPFQNGETVRDFFLRPRVIQLLIRQNYCDREAYWTGRSGLLDAIRPNRQLTPTAVVPGTLERVLPDNSRRRLDVFISEGPRFEPRVMGRWDERAFQEVLRFIAYNPVIYDPTEQQAMFTGEEDLVFPITFPIGFGSFGGALNVTYAGTWLEFPDIDITGPITDPVIENITTGERIELDVALIAGQSITITLTPETKTVVRNDGANMIGSVTTDSDLATFHLAADPEAPGGVNQLSAMGSGTTGASSISVRWRSRYFGI